MKRLLLSLATLGGLALPAAHAMAHLPVVHHVRVHPVAPVRWEHRHYVSYVAPPPYVYPYYPVPVPGPCYAPAPAVSIQVPPVGVYLGR